MPIYEYNCKEHGIFEMYRPVGLNKHPAPCHECGKLSVRAMSLTQKSVMDPVQVKAMDRNIKSQFEPHVCGSGCDHDHPHSHGPAPSSRPKPRQQVYQGPRSWVIEHAK